jgi:Na+-driven multidrug efflux pump
MTVPGNALGIAATTVVGQNMGRRDSEAAHRSLIYMMKLGTGILVILNLLICFPFARYLASMYTASPEIINITAFVLRFTNILIPLWTFAFILPAGLKGAGNAKFTLVVSMLSMWLVRIGLGYLLGVTFKMGLVGIWVAMTCDWAIRGVCFYLRLKRGKWRKNVVVKA